MRIQTEHCQQHLRFHSGWEDPMLPDLYAFMDWKLIDTASPWIADYNWLYLPFNALEALAWLVCAVVTWRRHRHRRPARVVWFQVLAFALFGLSDVIELSGTTPLLLLFKLALIIALVHGRRLLAAPLPAA